MRRHSKKVRDRCGKAHAGKSHEITTRRNWQAARKTRAFLIGCRYEMAHWHREIPTRLRLIRSEFNRGPNQSSMVGLQIESRVRLPQNRSNCQRKT